MKVTVTVLRNGRKCATARFPRVADALSPIALWRADGYELVIAYS